MVEGFDKEIDFLLRQTAQSETAFEGQIPDSRFQIPDANHLDNDEISAFAENALPEKIRRNYVTHLADCERCRKNLSSLIVLNSEIGSENFHADKVNFIEAAAAPIPWYRKLFAVPNLAYAMGALILVFAGVGILTVLRNTDSRNAEVSQITEKQISSGKGMSSDGETTTQEVFRNNSMSSNAAAMNNSISSNSAMNSSANLPKPAATMMQANSNLPASTRRDESNRLIKESPTDDKTLSKPAKVNPTTDAAGAAAPPPASKMEELPVNGRNTEPQADTSQGSAMQNQTTQNQSQIMPDTRNVQRAPMPAAKPRIRETEDAELKKSLKDRSDEKTTVGGKNFNRINNIWTDSTYRGQMTINVSRGTKEYKKLDSGLRGIVENLGGKVIVLWKEKAYRIQ